MQQYNCEVITINEPKNRQFFPEQFSNEIYYSNLEGFNYFSYRSNFSIKYIIKGQESYILDGKRYTAKAGQYLLVNDGRTVETSHDCISEALSIFIDLDIVSDVYRNFLYSETELMDDPGNPKIPMEFFENSYRNMDELGVYCGAIYNHIICSGTSEIELSKETYFTLAEKLILTQKNVRRSISEIKKERVATREELYRRILVARDFIECNALQEFSFDDISAHCHMSRFQLIRVFKIVIGTTPYQFYLRCKIKVAMNLLQDMNFKVGTVADICGFNDVFSFSKTFRRFVGTTPTEYRKSAILVN